MTITLTREEAQQVLDALEMYLTMETHDEAHILEVDIAPKAIELLRARLAQPDPEQTRSEKMREAGYTKRDTRLECDECGKKFTRQMLPVHDCQPEPVSVTDKLPKPEPVATVIGKFLDRKDELRTCIEPDLPLGTTLYTAPQQREWQGLTDEEIWTDGSAMGLSEAGIRKFARAIEAKLKEKNGWIKN